MCMWFLKKAPQQQHSTKLSGKRSSAKLTHSVENRTPFTLASPTPGPMDGSQQRGGSCYPHPAVHRRDSPSSSTETRAQSPTISHQDCVFWGGGGGLGRQETWYDTIGFRRIGSSVVVFSKLEVGRFFTFFGLGVVFTLPTRLLFKSSKTQTACVGVFSLWRKGNAGRIIELLGFVWFTQKCACVCLCLCMCLRNFILFAVLEKLHVRKEISACAGISVGAGTAFTKHTIRMASGPDMFRVHRYRVCTNNTQKESNQLDVIVFGEQQHFFYLMLSASRLLWVRCL